MHAIDSAQGKLGRPVTSIEIFVELKHLYTVPIKNVYEVAALLTSLEREDMLYTNDVGSHFSTQPFEDYKNYSQIFRHKFGTEYALDSEQRVTPVTARTVNFAKLMEVLKSSDEKLF